MGKDLGTYHLRVELEDGRGWIETWNTGIRPNASEVVIFDNRKAKP